MKKLLPLAVIILVTQMHSYAQRSYISISGGYGLPLGGQTLGDNYSSVRASGVTTATDKGVYGSYGSGFFVGGSYGYLLSKNIGLDLNVFFLNGKEYQSHYSYTTNNVQVASGNASTYSRGLFANPNFILTVDKEGIKPYAKLGISVGTLALYRENYDRGSATNPQEEYQKVVINGGLAFGLTGAVGVDFALAKKLKLFTEINFTSMNYYPKQAETTAYTVNGVDQLPGVPDNQKKVTYKDEVTSSSSSSTATTPNEDLKSSAPLGNVRGTIGIKYSFGSM